MTEDTKIQPEPSAYDAFKGRWQLTNIQPTDVLSLLPRMHRVMIALRGSGFMHERLGVVESVAPSDDDILIKGTEQDITVPEAALMRTVLDISTEMRGKLYPKLEFIGEDGERVFSITALEGLEPFEAALSTIARETLERSPVPARGDDPTPDVGPDDPSLTLLERLSEDRDPVQIRALSGGAVQRWDGVIEKINPMGGYINVMTSGFHLHLAAGAVTRWETDGGIHRAIDSQGQPIGLEVVAP